ncbi:cupin domain-containing protein [Candidatus Sumerlaeota bacterium]|nr:cupin domain-containing protein [Candidatus Sumerlaeota bacterium]
METKEKILILPTLGVPAEEVKMEGASGATIRKVITDEEGAPHFAMRLFELAPEGHTPAHRHEHEHEIYIIQGKGALQTEEGLYPLNLCDAVFIPPNALHNFINQGTAPFRFLCFIPIGREKL